MDAEIGQIKWTLDPDKPVWTPDQPADAASPGKREILDTTITHAYL